MGAVVPTPPGHVIMPWKAALHKEMGQAKLRFDVSQPEAVSAWGV